MSNKFHYVCFLKYKLVRLLVGGAAEEEAEELERLEPDHLAVGAEHLEDGPHAALGVEGGDQRGRMVAHERHEHLEDVVEVLVLPDGGQVVEERLQLVLLHAVPDHHQLLHKE